MSDALERPSGASGAAVERVRSRRGSVGSDCATIILATHSPVVLNQIRDRERVFVTESIEGRFPIPLDEHPNHEWLAHFSIGDAYANEEVGAPQAAE